MLGIIGGTGLYKMAALQLREAREIMTPFGAPSSPLMLGTLAGRPIAFLSRHGLHHERTPGEINFRANIFALKSIGVRTVVGVSAVGSLRQELAPGDLALPAQYIDWTRGRRESSFFGNGVVAHVSTATPTCASTAKLIATCAAELGMRLHLEKTYACVEGPRLGTRAESVMLRNAGADLVGMTNVPEAFLACEAQLGYCTVALVTDYDCWLDDPSQHVTADMALGLFKNNLMRVQQLIARVAECYVDDETRPCRHSLQHAMVTPEERMSVEQRQLVGVLLQ